MNSHGAVSALPANAADLRIGFIGAGRLGQALAWSLTQANLNVVGVSSKGKEKAKVLADRIHACCCMEAQALIDDALAVQEAGAFAVVLEMVPAPIAAQITEKLEIPTIGIGAGSSTDA